MSWQAIVLVYAAAIAILGWIALRRFGKPAGVRDAEEPDSIEAQLSEEAAAMVRHAQSLGIPIQATEIAVAADFEAREARRKRETVRATLARKSGAASSGVEGGPHDGSTERGAEPQGEFTLADLASTHRSLAKAVAPALPRSLRVEHFGKLNPWLPFLGRVRLVRHMIYVSVVALVLVLAFGPRSNFSSVSSSASGNGLHAHGVALMAATSSGVPTRTWQTTLSLLSAALLGAAFYSLSNAFRYVSRHTFDPATESSYWYRLVLGVVAGSILAVAIPISTANDTGVSTATFTKPLLAILGGYSVELVQQILNRLVAMVRSLFDESPDDKIESVRHEAALNQQQGEAATRERLRKKITELDTAGSLPADVRNQLYDALTPGE